MKNFVENSPQNVNFEPLKIYQLKLSDPANKNGKMAHSRPILVLVRNGNLGKITPVKSFRDGPQKLGL